MQCQAVNAVVHCGNLNITTTGEGREGLVNIYRSTLREGVTLGYKHIPYPERETGFFQLCSAVLDPKQASITKLTSTASKLKLNPHCHCRSVDPRGRQLGGSASL